MVSFISFIFERRFWQFQSSKWKHLSSEEIFP